MEGEGDYVARVYSVKNPDSPENYTEKLYTNRKRFAVPGNDNQRMVQAERNRRAKMNEHYSQLQSMVPNLCPKATRATIVDETISYIQELEGIVKGLEERQMNQAPPCSSIAANNIVVRVLGKFLFVGICGETQPGLASRVFRVFEKHLVKVLTAGISCSNDKTLFTITAGVHDIGGGATPEMVVNRLKSDLVICLS